MNNQRKYFMNITIGIIFLVNVLLANCFVVWAENTSEERPVNAVSPLSSEEQKAERKKQKSVNFIRSGAALKKKTVAEKPLHIKELSAVKAESVKKIGIEMTDKIKLAESKEIKAYDEEGFETFKRIQHKKLKPAGKSQSRESVKGVKIQKTKEMKKLTTIRRAVK